MCSIIFVALASLGLAVVFVAVAVIAILTPLAFALGMSGGGQTNNFKTFFYSLYVLIPLILFVVLFCYLFVNYVYVLIFCFK